MHKFVRNIFIPIALFISFAHAQPYQKGQPSAIDIAQLFLSFGSDVGTQQINQLLQESIGSNMNIDANYLEVAFYDKRTGQKMQRQKIRELMGPVRQDGALDLLMIADSMLPNGLPMQLDRIMALLDAAYIASMRKPPEYIDIEFYDSRCGPTGVGGGVSGATPQNRCNPATGRYELAYGESEQKIAQAQSSKEKEDREEKKGRWHGLDMELVQHRPLAKITSKQDALQRFKQEVDPKNWQPEDTSYDAIVMQGTSAKELMQQVDDLATVYESQGVEIVDVSMPTKTLYGQEVMYVYFYLYYR